MGNQKRHRLPTLAATILLMLAGACGGDPVEQPDATPWTPPASHDPADARWPGKLGVDHDTGALTAPGFNTLIDTAAPAWAKAPDTTLGELLQLDSMFEPGPRFSLLQETEREETILTVTITKLGDDSVQAIRYRVVFTRGADERYRFVSGTWSIRCQSGRGHQSFETGKCF